MNFEIPSHEGFTIYTKPNCSYCTRAKQLLQCQNPKIIDCDRYLATSREPFLEFIKNLAKKEYKTFPMIFDNGVFIGGFTETKQYFEREFVDWDDACFS